LHGNASSRDWWFALRWSFDVAGEVMRRNDEAPDILVGHDVMCLGILDASMDFGNVVVERVTQLGGKCKIR
jgi:hypothetical protein